MSILERKKTAGSHIKRTKSLLNTIGTLPPEVLITIFQIYVDDAGGIALIGSSPLRIPPNIPASVCRLWRDLTLSTATLWTDLSVTLWGIIQPEMLEIVLSRSYGSPLNLQIVGYQQGSGVDTLQTLVNESHRWRCLSLIRSSQISLSSFKHIALPSLEHLRVHCPAVEDYSNEILPLRILECAPKLKSFEGPVIRAYLPLPWLQLTSIRCTILEDLMESMLLCSGASFLSISFDPNYIFPPDEGDITKPSINFDCTDLELNIIQEPKYMATSSAVFMGISCPKLRRLGVKNKGSSGYREHYVPALLELQPIQKLALQSHGQLRSLSITHIAISLEGSFSDLFSELPLLENLTIVEYRWLSASEKNILLAPSILHTPLLDDLTALRENQADTESPHIRPLLPRLQTLEIGVGFPSSHFSVSAFQSLVESRWLPNGEHGEDGVVCLREVIFSSGGKHWEADFLEDKVMDSLKSVVQMGMKVRTGKHYYNGF
jgi:hypothetical protein